MKLTFRQKAIIKLAVLLAAIYFTFMSILNSSTLHNYAINNYAAPYTDSLGIKLELGNLSLSLLPPSINFDDINISPLNEQGSAVAVKNLNVTLSLWDAILGKAKIGTLKIKNSKIEQNNLDRIMAAFTDQAPKEHSDSTPIHIPNPDNVFFRDIVILDTQYLYSDKDITIDANLKEFKLYQPDKVFNSNPSYNVDANIPSLKIRQGANDLNLNIASKIKVTQRGILDSTINVAYEESSIESEFSGSFKFENESIKGVKLDTKSTSKLALKPILALLDIQASGELKGKTSTTLELFLTDSKQEEFKITHNSEFEHEAKNLTIDSYNLMNSKFSGKASNDSLSVEKLQIIDDHFNLKAVAEATIPLKANPKIDVKLSPDNLLLSDLMKILQVDFDAIDFGMTSDNVDIKVQTSPFNMKIDGPIFAENLGFKSALKVNNKPDCNFDFHAQIGKDSIMFKNSSADCFINREQTKDKDPGSIPASAEYITNINFIGGFYFDDEKGADFKIKSDQLDLGLTSGFTGNSISGFGQHQTHIVGPYNKVSVKNKLNARNVAMEEVLFSIISTDVSIKDEAIHIDHFLAKEHNERYINITNSSIGIEEPYQTKLNVEANNLEQDFLSTISRMLGEEDLLSGKIVDLNAKLKGKLLEPFNYTGSLKAELSNVLYQKELLASKTNISAILSEENINVEELTIHQGRTKITSNFVIDKATKYKSDPTYVLSSLGLQKDQNINLQARIKREYGKKMAFFNNDGRFLKSFALFKEFTNDQPINSNFAGTINLKGPIEGPSGRIELESIDTTFLNNSISNIRLKAIVNPDLVDVIFNQGGSDLEGRFSIDLKKNELPYKWYINAKNLDLKPFLGSALNRDPRNYAYFAGESQFEGELVNFWKSSGSLNIKSVNGSIVKENGEKFAILSLKEPNVFLYKKGELSFEKKSGLEIVSGNSKINLNIDNTNLPENLNIKLSSDLDLAKLKELDNSIEHATGSVHILGKLSGSLERPQLILNAKTRKELNDKGEAAYPSVILSYIRPSFSDINLDVEINDGILKINRFTTKKGGGNLQLDGTFKLWGSKIDGENNLTLSLDQAIFDLPVPQIRSINTTASGNIVLSGANAPYRLEGQLNIDKAVSANDFDIRDEIITNIREGTIQEESLELDPLIVFDISLAAPKNIVIKNRNIDVILDADLRLTGNDIEPKIGGQVAIDQGTFDYKRKFKITYGTVIFDDPLSNDPSLDIHGKTKVSTYEVAYSITGKASNPKFDLSVDPPTYDNGSPISKIDILLLLSRGNLPQKTSQDVATEQIARTEALNLIVGQFEDPVEKLFKVTGQGVVKDVYLDLYASSIDGSPIPRLNVPLNASEKWDVIFRVDTDIWKLSTEYNLHKSILLSGSTENLINSDESQSSSNGDADYAVDIKFRFAFP